MLRTLPDFKMVDDFCMGLYVCRLNSTVECIPYHLQLSSQNALQLIQQYPFFCGVKLLIYIILYTAWHQCWSIYSASVYLCLWGLLDFASLIYDIVADCSDNVPTRYLVNDACVLSSKPLVSASALRLEGQVMIKICIICSGFQTFLYLTLCVCS